MDAPLKCMFDTNVFNRILDGVISLEALSGRVVAHATHIQQDEINNTKNTARRNALAEVFRLAVSESTPTDSFVLDISRLDVARLGKESMVLTTSGAQDVSQWDQASWGMDDNLYSGLKAELDKLNKNKPNNAQDALIAETSIKGGYVLATDDHDLAEVTKKYNGKCLSVDELLRHLALYA